MPLTFAGPDVEVPLTIGPTAAYGDATLQLTVVAADGTSATTSVAVFVRGVPGALDTSFGTAGTAQAPSNAELGAVEESLEGTLYAVGTSLDATKKSVIVKYTDSGALDSAFGTAGRVDFAPENAAALAPPTRGAFRAGLRFSAGQVEYTARYALGSGPSSAATAFIANTGTASPTSKPPVLGGDGIYDADIAFADADGFVSVDWSRHEPPFYASRTTFTEASVTTWGTSGKAAVSAGGTPSTPFDLRDIAATNDRLYFFGEGRPPSALAMRFLVILDRATGADIKRTVLDFDQAAMSRPNAQGHVLLSYGGPPGTCVQRVTAQGVLSDAVVDGCFSHAGESDGFGGRAFFLRDGSVAAIDYGATGALHVATAAGTRVTPEEGIALEDARVNVIDALSDVFEDSRHRLVIVSSKAGADDTSWRIRRFWL
jgi:hypothetical protein